MSATSPTFKYNWVIRCNGKKENKSPEYRMISEAPGSGITPVLEVIDSTLLRPFVYKLKAKYGTVLIDFPLYLLESSSKFDENIKASEAEYGTAENFFNDNKAVIDIPVVSARYNGFVNFDKENQLLLALKKTFGKVAVRVRVPTYDLSETTGALSTYKELLINLSHNDILLLDVFNLSGSEGSIDLNLRLMTGLGKKVGIDMSILNAFIPQNGNHNYGPLFSYRYCLSGFGDFATERRYPPGGGQGEHKIVRYYDWNRFVLREYREASYAEAAAALRSSNCWQNNPHHVSACFACSEATKTDSEGHTYWKAFRVLHYLHSITNETKRKYNSVTSDQDLDPDGYDTLFNVGRT
jgi:hypothetical protein